MREDAEANGWAPDQVTSEPCDQAVVALPLILFLVLHVPVVAALTADPRIRCDPPAGDHRGGLSRGSATIVGFSSGRSPVSHLPRNHTHEGNCRACDP
jgi:hypothetical protein